MSDISVFFDNAKDQFLQRVSSAFHTPMQQSMQTLKALRESDLNPDQSSHIEHLYKTLHKLHETTQNMSVLADVKAGRYRSQIKTFAPISLFESITQVFISEAQNKGLDFLIYIDPNMPKSVSGDEKSIRHLLENLISNAIQFTPKGGSVYLDIRTQHIGEHLAQLDVSITDTGHGIAKDKIPVLVEPFNADSSDNLGVGLSSSYHLLKALGSHLKIASEEGKGSRFAFSLQLQTSFKPCFEQLSDLKVGVFIDDRSLFSYAKLIYQYLISMGIAVVSVKESNDPHMSECHALILITNMCTPARVKKLESLVPGMRVIPTMHYGKHEALKLTAATQMNLSLPALPSKIHNVLTLVESQAPKEISQANRDDQKVLQRLAVAAKREKLKILVVEDNPINLKLVKVVLSRYDFEVDQAEDGKEAVDKCRQKQYDLVLMDIDMPVMNGIEATNLIKEHQKANDKPLTPIVALTTHDLVGEREEILASGLDEHMPKPLNVGRLERMLERYLGYQTKKV